MIIDCQLKNLLENCLKTVTVGFSKTLAGFDEYLDVHIELNLRNIDCKMLD